MHHLSTTQALAAVKSNAQGLSEQEAALRLQGGANVIDNTLRRPFLVKALLALADPMIIILFIASALSFSVALYNFYALDGTAMQLREELFEGIIIVIIVLANALLSAMQEHKAENSLAALRRLSVPFARVLREGKQKLIPSSQVVVGDILLISQGDIVAADCRILRCTTLEVDQSALTGESVAVNKHTAPLSADTPLADRCNCLYASSAISMGEASAVVFATAYNTEVGSIARELRYESESTPLQKRLASLSKTLGVICLIISAFCFLLGLTQNLLLKQSTEVLAVVMTYFLSSISLAVAAIPEGLPTVVTIVLSRGVSRLVEHNAVVKRLTSVETLGCATVICTDKTGTLTKNQMTVVRCAHYAAEELPNLSAQCQKLLTYAHYCCNTTLQDGVWQGSDTEKAISAAAKPYTTLTPQRVGEIPFSSQRKTMTVTVRSEQSYLTITKGAWEKVSVLCGGFSQQVTTLAKDWSTQGLRVLGVAAKITDSIDNNEDNLRYVGIIGIADVLRQEAKKSILTCYAAGIKPVIITGDHPQTALAIAKQVGIYRQGDRAIDGQQLEQLNDEQLALAVNNCSVFARITPLGKLRIVSAYRSNGNVVALIGDGVNDAPALKKADIGCAMGRGTQVAKASADMVLTDDNFATVVEAVKVGRVLFSNLKECVRYLLSCNIGEVLIVLLAMLVFGERAVNAVQLLWINLVTDTLPAIAIGIRKGSDNVMKSAPRGKHATFFDAPFTANISLFGAIFGIASFVAYVVGRGCNVGSTMVFLTLSLAQLVFSLSCMSGDSLFVTPPLQSKNAILLTLISFALVFVVVLTPLSAYFGLEVMPPLYYLAAIMLALLPCVAQEVKYVLKNFSKRRKFAKIDR